MNLSQFNAQTLSRLASMAVELSSCRSYNNYIPKIEANKRQKPILSRVSLDGIVELQHYHLIVGIQASLFNVPYEIRNLTHRPITINQSSLMFETPIFGRSLAQTPINVVPGRESALLVVTLPDSMIKECGTWWELANSTEEFVVIPDVLKIKYNSVNVLNTILGKQY